MDNASIKAEAKQELGGNMFGEGWIMGVVLMLLSGAILSASVFTAVGEIILMGPVMVGVGAALLNAGRRGSKIEITDLFTCGFQQNFVRNMLVGIMQVVFVWLWSLLLVVPGIIKAYSYSMAFFIAQDNPNYDWKTCLDESASLMQGHKLELFFLQLSFIGWILLSMVTFGLAAIWAAPYMQMSTVVFYRKLIGDMV